MASVHVFIKDRKGKASCECGWIGKPSKDKKKSWKAHVRRASG